LCSTRRRWAGCPCSENPVASVLLVGDEEVQRVRAGFGVIASECGNVAWCEQTSMITPWSAFEPMAQGKRRGLIGDIPNRPRRGGLGAWRAIHPFFKGVIP
jgi:hypothetical protein